MLIRSLSERWLRLAENPLLGNLTAAAAGKSVFFGAALLRNLFLAKMLGPLDFGAWSLGLVWLQYAQWSHFSLLNAFRLDGARNRGAGDISKLQRLRRLTWTACTLPAIFVVMVAAGLSLMLGQNVELRNSLLMMAALILPFQLHAFASSWMSTEEKFVDLAKLQTIYAVLNMLLTLMLAFQWRFWGALIAQIASYILILMIFRRHFSLYLRPLFDWGLIAEQFKIGLPVGLNGLIYSLFLTLDRTLVASGLGIAALGQYGLTTLARSSIGLIPDAISEVLYMRISNRYGETRSANADLAIVLYADVLLACVTALIIGLIVIWIPSVVRFFLPDYQGGILALQIFVVGMFFCFPVYTGVLLTSIGRAPDLLVIYTIAIVLQTLLVLVGIRAYNIAGAAMATAGASVFLFVAINCWGLGRLQVDARRILAHLLTCLVPLTAMLAGLGVGWILIGRQNVALNVPSRELVLSLILLLFSVPATVWGIRHSAATLTALQHA